MRKYILLLLAATFFVSCQTEEKPQARELAELPYVAPINPNGESELAHLMRQMNKQLGDIRNDLLVGKTYGKRLDYTAIKTATPTDDNTKGDNFDAFSSAYLAAIDLFNKANTLEEQSAAFNGIINNCLACHQVTCPGPISRINKLWIDVEK